MNPIVRLGDGATALASFASFPEGLPDNAFILAGWDMECSALLSSASAMGLKLAVALVVSYTSKQAVNIGKGGDARRSDDKKALVHRIENDLILRAIDFLFKNALRTSETG